MLIVADENIPLLDAFFAGFGEIRRYSGRGIDAACVREADVLLVRSVTRVDRALLEGSKVRFVGTCTIGTDHLDLEHLAEAGIHWTSAPGCNARGVVDYVLGSLLTLAELDGVALAERTYGVVGAGEVGARLVKVLQGLGWKVLVCDPPRQAREGGDFVELDTLLERCALAPGWSMPVVGRWWTTGRCVNCCKRATTCMPCWMSGKANPRSTWHWPTSALWPPRISPATASMAVSAVPHRCTRLCVVGSASRSRCAWPSCCPQPAWRGSSSMPRPSRPGSWLPCAARSTTRAVTMPICVVASAKTAPSNGPDSTACASSIHHGGRSKGCESGFGARRLGLCG